MMDNNVRTTYLYKLSGRDRTEFIKDYSAPWNAGSFRKWVEFYNKLEPKNER